MKTKATASVLTSVLTLMLALSAHAESKRYLVVMKDAQNFKTAQSAMLRPKDFARGKVLDASAHLPATQLARLGGRLEASLEKINSLVVTGEESSLEKLRQNPAVAMIEAEVFHPAPKPMRGVLGPAIFQPTRVSQNIAKGLSAPGQKTPWGILTVRAFEAWPLGREGAGTRVLVLDTGIDREHPAVAANFEKGENFVADNPTADPFADTIGHGTHVAGTIAGVADDSGFTGVAPKAKILAGRVCSDKGCSNISIAQGVNWGIAEKVDVISMSLGGMWSTPAERDAIRKAEAAGVTIVAASGNDGTRRVSYPAALPEVIAVGAVDDKLQKAAFSQYGPELAIVAPGVQVISAVPRGTGRDSNVQIAIGADAAKRLKAVAMEGAADVPTPIENTLAYAGLGRAMDFAEVNVAGKFVLIGRGENTFVEKVQNALAAGASGVLIFNNAPGLIRGALTQDGTRLNIPVFMIEQEAGETLRAALGSSQVVRSRMAIIPTDYSPFDGTSMATPHVSGVVALMKAANRALRPSQIKQILQQTAKPLGPNTNNEFGAGLVDAEAAVRAAAAMTVNVPEEAPVLP